MNHLRYFDDKDNAVIEKELRRLTQLHHERNREFEIANRRRNIIVIFIFAIAFFLLICVLGKPTGENILWAAVISICLSLFHYFVNYSIFVSWLSSKRVAESSRLSALEKDIAYLEKLYEDNLPK